MLLSARILITETNILQMKKSIEKTLLQMLFLLSFASCDQGGDNLPEETVTPADRIPRVASVSMPTNRTTTRTIITGTEETPADGAAGSADKLSGIGVYAVRADGTEYKPTHGSNTAAYQKETTGWLNASRLDATNLFLPTAYSVNLYAWHPAGLPTGYVTSGNFYVSNIEIRQTDNFSATQQTDYLYAAGCLKEETTVAAVKATDNPGLYFKMQHAMAKLVFTVKKDVTNTETLKLQQFKLKTSDAKGFRTGEGSNRRMNLTTGAFNNLLPSSELTYTESIPQEVTSTGVKVIALVAPVNSLGTVSFELSMEVGGKDTRLYRTKALSNATTWEQGKVYSYTLKIEKMSADIVGDKEAEVKDWTTETDEIPIQ